jgi:ABC-type branched-subunit amino acid transport system substrate-binding protein
MRNRPLLGLAAIGAAAIVVAACGTGGSSNSASSSVSGSASSAAGAAITSGPGVDLTTKTITIGNIAAISGPAAALGVPVLDGAQTAVKAINAGGGVDGFMLKLKVQDAAYVPQNAVTAFNGMQSSVAMIENFGSPTTEAILPAVKADGILILPQSWDSAWDSEPNLAPLGTPYAYDIANGLDYLVKVKHLGTKVGIIYQDDAYGADGLRGFKAAVKADGLKDVAEATEAVTDTEFTAQVQKMKAAGAQIVVLTTLPTASGPIVGTAATLGYSPTFLFQGPAWLEQLMTKTGAQGAPATPIASALAKSTYVMSFATPWGNTQAPGMAAMLAAVKTYAPKQIPSVYFTWAWEETHLAAAILGKAIAAKDLSRQGILSARRDLGAFDTEGLTPALDYGPSLGPPSTKSIIDRVDPSVLGFLKAVASGYQGADTSGL